MEKRRVISIDVSIGLYANFIDEIIELSKANISDYVCVANVHMLVEAHNDGEFAKVVNNAAIITPDGMPIAKSLKILYGIKQQRVAGMDLLPDLLKRAEHDKLSVFFYGGTSEMMQGLEKFLNGNHPALQFATYCPPFRQLTEHEQSEVVSAINLANPNLIFVILGCPKQERWMAQMKGKIKGVMVGVGGALPVLTGQQKRAPLWAQRLSLEWLFRLMQEPKRLFKRYYSTNTKFLALLLQEKIFKN